MQCSADSHARDDAELNMTKPLRLAINPHQDKTQARQPGHLKDAVPPASTGKASDNKGLTNWRGGIFRANCYPPQWPKAGCLPALSPVENPSIG
jgi:hypothetical protein